MQTVSYEPGEVERMARTTLTHAGFDGFLRCGQAGAVWRLSSVDERPDGGIDVALFAVDPHDVPLTEDVWSLPLPSAPKAESTTATRRVGLDT
jgi:hypothetical protein